MKPCSKNRKLIAWLAVDALDGRQALDLRAHLETCEGCRQYLQELSHVTEKLAAAGISSDIEPSGSFHRRVVARLRAAESVSVWESLVAHLRGTTLNWRVALPVIAAIAVLIAASSGFVRRPDVSPHTQFSARTALVPNSKSDLLPTIANYQMVANQSLDKLDELLTRQGNRNPSPTQIYTASTLAPASVSD